MSKPDKTRAQSDTQNTAITAAMMAMSPVATKAWLDIMSETTRFVTDRLQKDLATQQAMLSCKNPAELLQVQSEYVKAATEQYSEEAMRLFNSMSKATIDTIEEARSGHRRSYDDVPL